MDGWLNLIESEHFLIPYATDSAYVNRWFLLSFIIWLVWWNKPAIIMYDSNEKCTHDNQTEVIKENICLSYAFRHRTIDVKMSLANDPVGFKKDFASSVIATWENI